MFSFEPEQYKDELVAIIDAINSQPKLDDRQFHRLQKKHPKGGSQMFSKGEIIAAFRHFETQYDWPERRTFLDKVRMKPVRTQSGVAPVTVLTKPFPCPGACIFCPTDVRMPKSYLADEPGAQRAAQNEFDPYLQTYNRLRAFEQTGHPVDKIELLILGGTWSAYPECYQIWFVKRCIDAMNDYGYGLDERAGVERPKIDYRRLPPTARMLAGQRTYNQLVTNALESWQNGELLNGWENASWDELRLTHEQNETAGCRCVGLVLETRPDHINLEEVTRLRKLGGTKVAAGHTESQRPCTRSEPTWSRHSGEQGCHAASASGWFQDSGSLDAKPVRLIGSRRHT